MQEVYKSIQVAEVISSSQVVLNIGAADGVKMGDEFIVYGLSENDIIDPATNESLGKLELFRGIGMVCYMQDTMCILQSISNQLEKFNIAIGGSGSSKFASPQRGDYAKINATKAKSIPKS